MSTSRRRAVQLSSRYGWCDGTVYAQNAPGRLPGRIGASIHGWSKKLLAASASSGENDAYASRTSCTRFVPPELRFTGRDGRHAVVVGDAVEAEQPGLERVPALRDVVALDDGLDQRLHRLVARLVGEVAAREPAVVVAQAVVGRLVGEQRVEHERAGPQPGREPGGDRGRRVLRTSRSGACSRERPCSSDTVESSRSTVMAEVSSLKRRAHALRPVTYFSAISRSSGSLSRCGR